MRAKAGRNDSSRDGRRSILSRRRFLRGLGASVALPAFTSLVPYRSLAAAPAAGGMAATTTGRRFARLSSTSRTGRFPPPGGPRENPPTSR